MPSSVSGIMTRMAREEGEEAIEILARLEYVMPVALITITVISAIIGYYFGRREKKKTNDVGSSQKATEIL